MIVDDAVVVRGLVGRWLMDDGAFDLVANCRRGAEALDIVATTKVDVLILDLDLPDIDGFTLLPLLQQRQPGMAILVLSALGHTQADVALRCMQDGVADFISKPERSRDLTVSQNFRRDFVERVRALGLRNYKQGAEGRAATSAAVAHVPVSHAPVSHAPVAPAPVPHPVPAAPRTQPPEKKPPVRPAPTRASRRPTLLAIGASTGGPNAVLQLLVELKSLARRVPVVVVQHMPANFTPVFADHIRRHIGVDTHEARDEELIFPGKIYIAPGGRHMSLTNKKGGLRAVLSDGPPVNFCKPAVDVLFSSAAEMLGAGVIAVILTGMGSDGLAGSTMIKQAGGTVFAQDEATSVVWGMPGAVARAGLCQGIGTIPELGKMLNQFIGVEAA